VGTLTILMAGVGVWFLIEGAMCALAPDLMRSLGQRLTELPQGYLVAGGLIAATLGAVLVTIAVRTA
jgi:uncharacterized protein YjeT (DUF2065 family)